ncbi:unnamed protein product [Closterium sp. NIES-54]
MKVKEALASWKGKAVKAAMEEEIRSLVGMGAWELVERPPGVNIMKNCIVAVLDLNLMQLDMKNAFLQSKLDRVLYMYQPDYNDGTGPVCKLLKSLYSLKQSPLLWYRALDGVLLARWLEEEPGRHSALLQSRRQQGDLLGAGLHGRPARRQQQCSDAKGAEGAAKGCLRATGDLAGAEVPRAGDRARQVGEEGTGAPGGGVPAEGRLAAVRGDGDDDIVCSKLGSGLTVRSDQHWREVARYLAYLANTRDTVLEFGGGAESLKLVGYVDADNAGDKQNQTSTGGYVFVFRGAVVCWSSQHIKCVMLSSIESEYVAATEAGKEGCRLRFLAEFRQLDAGTPTVLRVDNKSAITLAEGMGLTGNLKHMER